MHSVSGFVMDWFGHKCSSLALQNGSIFNDIFNNHCLIRHVHHIAQFYFDLHLSRAAYLMVVVFHVDSPVFHIHTHLAS